MSNVTTDHNNFSRTPTLVISQRIDTFLRRTCTCKPAYKKLGFHQYRSSQFHEILQEHSTRMKRVLIRNCVISLNLIGFCFIHVTFFCRENMKLDIFYFIRESDRHLVIRKSTKLKVEFLLQ